MMFLMFLMFLGHLDISFTKCPFKSFAHFSISCFLIFLFSIFNYYCAVVFQSWESFTSFSCTKKQCVISVKFYIGGTILYNSFSTLLFFTHHYIFDNNSC